MYKYIRYIFLYIILLFHTACLFNNEKNAPIIYEGKYIELSNERIKFYLPHSFEKVSHNDYEKIIYKVEDTIKRDNLLKRFKNLKWSKGNVYFMVDTIYGAELNVKMMDYIPMTKDDSRYVSSFLLHSCREISRLYNSECKRIASGFSDNNRTQLFKGVYEVNIDDENHFNTVYLITSNYKSFIVQFYSRFDDDFDPFIQKTIVQ